MPAGADKNDNDDEAEKAWMRVAEKLKDDNYGADEIDSKYIDKVRASGRYDVKGSHVQRLEEELMEEMAEALGRTVRRTDHAFACLDVALYELETAPTAAEWEERLVVFQAVRSKADNQRSALAVHRRALGFRLRNEQLVASMYPLPSPNPRAPDSFPED
eukprot:CAMPEP_0118861164 /NCGR_PEP_ID=MMETSP1163-20130328/6783_1 /TAXON_ID=124430 /ORGANISM="Phaeomonas parva, Strain CCMP2877" /LENGTH=159 /DNA_ID=CAMNT_0006794951 /DNA_START=345 /DNA_END=824 /DNA_ORIENTATION=-